MRAYKRAVAVGGGLAGILAAAYIAVVIIAAADGHGGVEVPLPVNGIAVGLIAALGIVWCAARIADTSNKAAAEQYIRPIIRDELEAIRPDLIRGLAEELGPQLGDLQEREARRIATSVAALAVAGAREALADDAEERLQRVLATGRRYGAVMEAQSHRVVAKFPTEHLTVPNGAKVHPFPNQRTDDA